MSMSWFGYRVSGAAAVFAAIVLSACSSDLVGPSSRSLSPGQLSAAKGAKDSDKKDKECKPKKDKKDSDKDTDKAKKPKKCEAGGGPTTNLIEFGYLLAHQDNTGGSDASGVDMNGGGNSLLVSALPVSASVVISANTTPVHSATLPLVFNVLTGCYDYGLTGSTTSLAFIGEYAQFCTDLVNPGFSVQYNYLAGRLCESPCRVFGLDHNWTVGTTVRLQLIFSDAAGNTYTLDHTTAAFTGNATFSSGTVSW